MHWTWQRFEALGVDSLYDALQLRSRVFVLEQVGGFEPGLDRVGTPMLSSGDVFLEKRVMACGYQVL